MKRKIIQISTAQYENDYKFFTTALCDDGTVWELNGDGDGANVDTQWKLLPSIPQYEIEAQN